MQLTYTNLGTNRRKYFYQKNEFEIEFYIDRTPRVEEDGTSTCGDAEIVWRTKDDLAFKQFIYDLMESYNEQQNTDVLPYIEADIRESRGEGI